MANKIFCMDCGIKIPERTNLFGQHLGFDGMEYENGVRCLDCADEFRNKKIKRGKR